MTCRDKYVKDHPGMLLRITRSGCIPPECPSNYGYLEDPCYCDPDSACRLCWEREIPENKEKENENMSDELIEKAYNEKYGSTSASSHMYDVPERTDATKYETCDLDYKAEYGRLLVANNELKAEVEKAKRQRELDLIALKEQTSMIEKYEFGFRVAEAFLGHVIVNNWED